MPIQIGQTSQGIAMKDKLFIKLLVTCLMTFFSLSVMGLSSNVSTQVHMNSGFQLTDHNGKKFHLSDKKSKVVLLFFGYTSCPDVCPMELSTLSRLLTSLKDKADKVQVLFITVDPDRDTPERLKEYVSFFNPNILGLTGSKQELTKVTGQYYVQNSVPRQNSPNEHYSVDHSANLYLLNGKGHLVSIIPFGLPFEHIQQMVNFQIKILK